MALKVMDIVAQRVRIIAEIESGRLSVREAAATYFRASKTQVYEWLGRYRAAGPDGLVPHSRRPLHSPAMTSAEIEDEIVRVHKERLGRWGAKKIRAHLCRSGARPCRRCRRCIRSSSAGVGDTPAAAHAG